MADGGAKLRLFVAVPLPEELKDTLAQQTALWKKGSFFQTWVHPQDYHLTLKFLGETPAGLLPPLKEALHTVARKHAPFSLTLEGMGTFGQLRRPRILWLGVKGEGAALASLQRDVEEELATLGFKKEERPFRPHLTLARKYVGQAPFKTELLREKELAPLSFDVEEIILYQSRLGEKPMYLPVARFRLIK